MRAEARHHHSPHKIAALTPTPSPRITSPITTALLLLLSGPSPSVPPSPLQTPLPKQYKFQKIPTSKNRPTMSISPKKRRQETSFVLASRPTKPPPGSTILK